MCPRQDVWAAFERGDRVMEATARMVKYWAVAGVPELLVRRDPDRNRILWRKPQIFALEFLVTEFHKPCQRECERFQRFREANGCSGREYVLLLGKDEHLTRPAAFGPKPKAVLIGDEPLLFLQED